MLSLVLNECLGVLKNAAFFPFAGVAAEGR